ncbi:MAG: hypothetical protein HOV82_21840 [Streptomyces sp.]|nr:hypothetical protein [Streptomyces sp.]
MTSIRFTTAPGWDCQNPAARVIELYAPKDGRAHGSLDGTLYVCEEHVERGRNAQWDGPITAYLRAPQDLSKQTCGYLVDYRDLDAPEETLVAAHAALGEAVKARLDMESTEELTLFAESLRLDVNGVTRTRGTLQEVQAAVVDVVTTRLALAPEHLAPEAQAIRGAFAEGDVQAALDERGQWYVVMDGHSDNPLRIKVEKEG